MTELSNAKANEIIVVTNLIIIYDAMAIVRLVTSEKIWQSLLQTLIKPFRLEKAQETLLVFDNYSDNQEFFIKRARKNKSSHQQYCKNVYRGKCSSNAPGQSLS